MTPVEFLLALIFLMLTMICTYVRWIYLRLEYPGEHAQPVNRYGETLTDAIQNSIVRGQRGIHTDGGY